MNAAKLVKEIENKCDTEEQLALLIEQSSLTWEEKMEASDILGLSYPYFN